MTRTAFIPSLRRDARRATPAVHSRKAERIANRRLRDQIATYDTPAAIADLLASASRSESGDALLVRDVLTHNVELIERRSTSQWI